MLITEDPQKVYNVLFKALDKLIENRIIDKRFIDHEDVTVQAYFSTLEGLDAMLIPFVNLPKNLFWIPLNTKYIQLQNIIIDDIGFILRSYNNKLYKPIDDQGNPYFRMKKGSRYVPYWTSECASFTLSVLINFLLLAQKFDIPIKKDINSKIQKAANANIKWLENCKRDSGWSWTNDSSSHPWPTWSILDTFEELLNCDFFKKFHKKVTNDCDDVIQKTIDSFNSHVTNTYGYDWKEKVIEGNPYDVEAALDLSRLMLAIALHNKPRIIKPLACILFMWCSKAEIKNIDYNYHLSIRNDNITDCSIIPSLLRTLIVMANSLKPKMISELDDAIGSNHVNVINRIYKELMDNVIPQGKHEGLWGVPNGGLNYELYYTERSIEALTEFLLYYNNDKVKSPDIYTEEELTKLVSLETTNSFDKNIINITPPFLPVLDEISNGFIREKGNSFLKSVNIIFVLHFLKDLIPFVEKYTSLGCAPENICFVVKTYRYPDRDKIISYYKENRYNVFVPSNSSEETFNSLTSEVLSKCILKSQENGNKILIIEDGGYFAPLYHTEEFKDNLINCLGAVEQTTKGRKRDEKISSFGFPIISVASSKLKTTLEGREVAETIQENAIHLIKTYINKPYYTLKALVLGFGSVGKKLSKSLANKGIKVYVYDIDPLIRFEAQLETHVEVIEDLNNLNNIDLIIGISGNTSLNEGKDFWNLKHNVYLLSGSSERIEFNLDTLDRISKSIKREGIITKYILQKDDKIINLFCDGEPVNFELSGGISNLIIDPVYAEMFLASMEIFSNKTLYKKLHNVSTDIENKVVECYKNYHKS